MEPFRFPKQIIVAHTIGTVQNQRVPCKLINFTNQPVTLRSTTRLVQAYFLPRTEHLPHIGKATISSVLEEPSFDNNFCYTLTETTTISSVLEEPSFDNNFCYTLTETTSANDLLNIT